MGKKKMYLVLDTETANDTNDSLVYDLGFCVCDRYGNVYFEKSFIISDTFLYNTKLMQSAYYAQKIPKYIDDMSKGTMQVVDIIHAKYYLQKIIKEFNVKAVCAYNARFDVRALNTTLRYYTKSKMRWFLPYGTEVYCIWNMACQLLYTKKKFFKFVIDNNLVSESGNLQTSAEVGYQFLTQDNNFAEEHRGLQDVKIETFIMSKCFAQKKKFDKKIRPNCWTIPTKNAKLKYCYGG